MNNINITEDRFLLSSLVRACRLRNDVLSTCLPIKKGMLCMILDQVDRHYGRQPFLSLLYKMLFSTTYFGLFRVSEVTSGAHPVLAWDVQVATNKKKILFILRSSKTHGQNTHPQMVKIKSTEVASIGNKCRQSYKLELPCPYMLLQEYTSARADYYSDTEPFFVFSDGMPVTQKQMGGGV